MSDFVRAEYFSKPIVVSHLSARLPLPAPPSKTLI
jgi:hypothetical protein